MRSLFLVLVMVGVAHAETFSYGGGAAVTGVPFGDPWYVFLSLEGAGPDISIEIQEMFPGTLTITADNAADYQFDWNAMENGLEDRLQHNACIYDDDGCPDGGIGTYLFIQSWAHGIDNYSDLPVLYGLAGDLYSGGPGINLQPFQWTTDRFRLDFIRLSYYVGSSFGWTISGHSVPEPSAIFLAGSIVVLSCSRRHRALLR